jgi:gamma-glutamyltranspeptidase/glutathione hydrolase
LEYPLSADLIDLLTAAGHEVSAKPVWSPDMGFAGIVARRADGWLEGGADPRGDGAVAAF